MSLIESTPDNLRAGSATGAPGKLRSEQPLHAGFHSRVSHLESLGDLLHTMAMTHQGALAG